MTEKKIIAVVGATRRAGRRPGEGHPRRPGGSVHCAGPHPQRRLRPRA